jgi:catechol 2,3-dioxygenase-like lactoylglutathione lyase family enzyme
MMKLAALDRVGLPVSDVDRSVEWYQRVLGLKRAFEDAWETYPAVLVANGTGVTLFPTDEPVTPSEWGSLAHVGSAYQRRATSVPAPSLRRRASSFGNATTTRAGRCTSVTQISRFCIPELTVAKSTEAAPNGGSGSSGGRQDRPQRETSPCTLAGDNMRPRKHHF